MVPNLISAKEFLTWSKPTTIYLYPKEYKEYSLKPKCNTHHSYCVICCANSAVDLRSSGQIDPLGTLNITTRKRRFSPG